MAKRYTDPDKWKDAWFRKLGGKYQLLWLYMLDNCSPAGLWEMDLDDFKFRTNFEITKQEVLEIFSDRLVHARGDLYFIPKFIKYQQPNFYQPSNNAHKSILEQLKYKGLENYLRDFYNLDGTPSGGSHGGPCNVMYSNVNKGTVLENEPELKFSCVKNKAKFKKNKK